MTIIPIFRDFNQQPEPWTADLCDVFRKQWADGIPRHCRKTAGRWSSLTEAERIQQRMERQAAMAPKVIEIYATGLGAKPISKQLGISENTVRDILRANNIPFHPPKSGKRRSLRAEQIGAMLKQGTTVKEIAAHFHLSKKTIRNVMHEHGLKAREAA